MRVKISILLISLSLLLTGCQSARKIETASIIENVVISDQNGEVNYTFYILSGSDKPKGVSVPADSFKAACELADSEYIPNLSLAKLRLLMIEDSLVDTLLKPDIEYISTQPSFSPSAYVAVCDGKTVEKFAAQTAAHGLIEQQLILLKKNNPEVNINYLSVFNHFESKKTDNFAVGYVACDNELKISERKLIKSENNTKIIVK